MSCFWFGHASSGKLADIVSETFNCRRCGHMIRWDDMDTAILRERQLVLDKLKENK